MGARNIREESDGIGSSRDTSYEGSGSESGKLETVVAGSHGRKMGSKDGWKIAGGD